MPLVAGSRVDSYEIVAPLGAGGMGEVYRARVIGMGSRAFILPYSDSITGFVVLSLLSPPCLRGS